MNSCLDIATEFYLLCDDVLPKETFDRLFAALIQVFRLSRSDSLQY